MKKCAFRFPVSPFISGFIVIISFLVTNADGGEPVLSKGQTVYVPAYSHIVIRQGKTNAPFNLSINLSVRNTDLKNSITIVRSDYYDSNGNHAKSFINEPVVLKPMASSYYFINQADTSGGWGANFIIKWKSETEVNEPIIESVSFGTRGTHSLSFVSRGKVIKE